MTIPVLVTDGAERSALAVVRSLGRAGYRPWVVAAGSRSLAGASRWAAGRDRAPDPLSDPEGFADRIERLAAQRRAQFVLPLTDASCLALLPARGRLGAVLLAPPEAAYRGVSDKARLLEEATRAGIRIPEQVVLTAPDDPARERLSALGFPLVLKPARSVGENGGGAGARLKLSVRHAADPMELADRLEALPRAAYPLLVQRRIVGPGVGIFLLLWEGRLVGLFAHRRIREKPPSGGVSVYRESIPADAGLVARSRALVERFGWQGVAMIEYKLDQATGEPYLMEINGRFWGSLQLAVDAGVDFPALLLAAALGRNPKPVTSWETGVRLRWFWGEMDHLLARLRRTPAELALAPGEPAVGRGRALRDALLPHRGDREEIFRWNDPRPFLHETLRWLRNR